jgi:catechol 2,3-dioxygenase-like lactoylglutathione lyase family enzyme
MSDDLSGRGLVQVGVTVADLPRAIDFYRDTLGFALLFETNGMAFFQLGNTRLMVGQARGALHPRSDSILYFDAPDLPALADALESRGVSFAGPAEVLQRTDKGELTLRIFADPDGNLLALMGVVSPS